MYQCLDCGDLYSETLGTPAEGLKSPVRQAAGVICVRSEGPGLRAAARCFGLRKQTVADWENRFAEQKAPLMLYATCHQFISLTFEGDELCTVAGERVEPGESRGRPALTKFMLCTGLPV